MLETTESSVAPNDTLHRYSTLVGRIRPLSGQGFTAATGDRDPWASTPPSRGRARWEATFFAAGFGRHPRYQQLVPYAAIEHEGPDVVMAFERLPEAGLTRFKGNVLGLGRDLHMGMLRESGQRADATKACIG